jgi:hypothetical protein
MEIKFFRWKCETFWPQKEWRNFGRAKRITSWRETKIQIKLAAACNKKKRLINLLTYSKEQSPSWEANHFSVSQEIPRILWNPKVHYRTPCARHLSLPSACALKVQDGFEENSSHWCEERSSGCYAANGGDFLLTFRDNLSVPSSEAKNPKAFGLLTREDRTDRLTRNVRHSPRHNPKERCSRLLRGQGLKSPAVALQLQCSRMTEGEQRRFGRPATKLW